MYVGFLHVNKAGEFKYHVQKIYLYEKDQNFLKNLKTMLTNIKSTMQKTPLTTEADYVKIEKDCEATYVRAVELFNRFCQSFTSKLNDIINPKIEEVKEEAPQPEVTGKKGAKDAGAKSGAAPKGGKGEPGIFTSSLPTPTSGIESVVLLVDERFSVLPWEKLEVFSKVPAISRDYSLNIFAKRLRNIGFKSETNNSPGIGKDKIKYTSYEFKPSYD